MISQTEGENHAYLSQNNNENTTINLILPVSSNFASCIVSCHFVALFVSCCMHEITRSKRLLVLMMHGTMTFCQYFKNLITPES